MKTIKIEGKDRKIIEVEVPKEIWDADHSVWNIIFGRRDIMGAWMKSIESTVKQVKK